MFFWLRRLDGERLQNVRQAFVLDEDVNGHVLADLDAPGLVFPATGRYPGLSEGLARAHSQSRRGGDTEREATVDP